jgi:ATP synthase protein I
MVFKAPARPIRIVLWWQVIATAVLSLIAALVWGADGAISAALGGGINVVAGSVFGWRVAQGEGRNAGEALRTMLRAEALKILLIVAGLWLVFSSYKSIVHAAFLAAFVITVVVFAAAIAVRDAEDRK